LYIVGIW